ncbi:MAG: copper chaperone, partial [Chitinophagaceae bacterium]|nr:copper chaperone [Chitinophagaceae bacterium]
MKTRIISLSIAFMFCSVIGFGQKVKNDTIKVWGNCGMCQKTIEKAAKDAGASYASWSDETHLLVVKYSDKATNSKKIQEKIASKGYDTQDVTASDATYDKLHGCCKYDRKATTASCCKDSS